MHSNESMHRKIGHAKLKPVLYTSEGSHAILVIIFVWFIMLFYLMVIGSMEPASLTYL